ncbi:MAG: GNAT family N-acetyltransferase [Ktedonobacterales bacterium]
MFGNNAQGILWDVDDLHAGKYPSSTSDRHVRRRRQLKNSCGGSTVMGTVAYIGLVGVEPSFQRRGVASYLMSQLLEWSYSRGCTTVLLDASDAGEPLYRRLGFVTEDTVGVWTASPPQLPLLPVRYTGIVQVADHGDQKAVGDADARWTGMPRRRIIQMFAADRPDRVLVARLPAGELEGYLIAQPQMIGPWLATSSEAAEALLHQGLPLAGNLAAVTVYAPSANQAATDILLRYGFTRSRFLAHMRLGIPLDADRRQRIYGQINLALG